MNNQNPHRLISRAKEYGSIPGVDTVKALLEELGNPQEKLPVIHIAGTNGKGSVASFLEAMLLENQYSIGIFTSPYFQDPREMFRHNRKSIAREDFQRILNRLEKAVDRLLEKGVDHPTEFEIYVALAFYYFSRSSVDFLLLEVGMGGREDATNVIEKPVLSIITQIGLDHTGFLGSTLQEVTAHKGGIIKKGVPVILYPQEPQVQTQLERLARELQSPVVSFNPQEITLHSSTLEEQCFSVDFPCYFDDALYSNVKIPLPGQHQVLNGTTALLAIHVLQRERSLRLSREKTLQGLASTRWPGRLEILGSNPLTLVDGAHNVPAAKSLGDTLKKHCAGYSITLLLGMLEDKDVDGFLSEIIPYVDRVVVTKPLNPRAMSPVELQQRLQTYSVKTFLEPSITGACSKALDITDPSGMILGVGSLYMIGEARKILLRHFQQ